MKANILFFSILIGVLFTSCGITNSDEYKELKAQNDSLKLAKYQMEREVNDYLIAINKIQENIETIKKAEGTITLQPMEELPSNDVISKLNDDIAYLNNMLQINKSELAKLKSKLSNSTLKINELEKTILRLTNALEAESIKVAALENELAAKNEEIATLTDSLSSQNENIKQLRNENAENQKQMKAQEEALHTAWYVFGTRKELKEQNIINSKGLFAQKKVLENDFNKDYFVKIDARKTTSIPLYSSHAKILTTHPKISYKLDKDNGIFVLVIIDTEAFWSISKYLVIEVD